MTKRVKITNKQTGQELTGVVDMEYPGTFDFLIDGCNDANGFTLYEWAIEDLPPELPTRHGSVILGVVGKGGRRFAHATRVGVGVNSRWVTVDIDPPHTSFSADVRVYWLRDEEIESFKLAKVVAVDE